MSKEADQDRSPALDPNEEPDSRPEDRSPKAKSEAPTEETRQVSASKDDEDDAKEHARPRTRSRSRTSRNRRHDEDDVIPQTEKELNVPKRETVVMLGLVSLLLLILWFSARLACNAHPDQVREPKHYSTFALAADPKNAAFEFQQQFETGHYEIPMDLSTGPMRNIVDQKMRECEKDPDACEERQQELAGKVESLATVLEQDNRRAIVEIESVFSSGESKTYTFTVIKDKDQWKVLDRREGRVDRPKTEASGEPGGAAGVPDAGAAQ